MKIQTNIKAGGAKINHNQTGLTIRTKLKAGGGSWNHNQTLAAAPDKRS